jgi:protein-S-isoprenylcysteine O-methyltransferase Ste14
MTLQPEIQIALRILQIIGLVLPIVFVALRPFYSPNLDVQDLRERQNIADSGKSGLIYNLDLAPTVVKFGVGVIVVFALSASLAGLRVAWFLRGSWVVAFATVLLTIGLVSLSVMFYLLRDRLRKSTGAN